MVTTADVQHTEVSSELTLGQGPPQWEGAAHGLTVHRLGPWALWETLGPGPPSGLCCCSGPVSLAQVTWSSLSHRRGAKAGGDAGRLSVQGWAAQGGFQPHGSADLRPQGLRQLATTSFVDPEVRMQKNCHCVYCRLDWESCDNMAVTTELSLANV